MTVPFTFATSTSPIPLANLDANFAAVGNATGVTYTAPFTGGVAETLSAKLAQYVSVKDFGAVGDNITDDTAAIQAALTETSGTVYLPAGDYKITSPLTFSQSVQLAGSGPESVIHAYDCDVLYFSSSNLISPRKIGNFDIYGHSTGGEYTAIKIDLDSSSGPRVTGLLFENICLFFFNTGVYSRGAWDTTYRKVVMNHVYKGYQLIDQNIKTLITDCRINQSGMAYGTGNTEGIRLDTGVYTHRPEDTWVVNTIIYGFDNAIIWRNALYGGVTGCDLDACASDAITITTADGGFTFSNNWVQVDNASTAFKAINFPSLGYTPSPSPISVSNNRVQTSSSTALTYGIYVGTNQTDINLDNNEISGFTGSGIRLDLSYRTKITKNQMYGCSLDLFNLSSGSVSDNYTDTGITLTSCTGVIFGQNFGANTTYAVASITMPAGQTTQTVTFASLGLGNLPTGSGGSVFFTNSGALSCGAIWGSCTSTSITVNTSIVLGANFGINTLVICI